MRQTEDELIYIKNYIELPILMEVIQRNIVEAKSVDFKLKNIFIAHLLLIQRRVNNELYDTKQEMRKRGLKVYEEQRTQMGVSAKYLCRGYRHEMNLSWTIIKAETEKKLAELLGVDIEKIEYWE